MGPTISNAKENNENINSPNTSSKKSSQNSRNETVFLLDWDDTLMCTTFIQHRIHPLSEEEQNIINSLGQAVAIFLEECKKYGKIIIMTNSNEDWMRKTASSFLKIRAMLHYYWLICRQ